MYFYGKLSSLPGLVYLPDMQDRESETPTPDTCPNSSLPTKPAVFHAKNSTP